MGIIHSRGSQSNASNHNTTTTVTTATTTNSNNNLLPNSAILVLLLQQTKIPTFILNLPVDLWKSPASTAKSDAIVSYLSSRDKKALSLTCTTFYKLCNEEGKEQRSQINTLFKVINDKPYDSEDLHKVLSHAAVGEWNQAKEVWLKDPSLLTRCGTVYRLNRIYQEDKAPIDIPTWQNPGRPNYKDCTAFQIACANEEWEEVEQMGALMTQEEKQRQFLELFPTGNIEEYNNKFDGAKKLLEAVFAAVIQDSTIDQSNLEKMNEKTREALLKLYDFVMPAREHKVGLVFDVNIYIEALKLYEDKIDDFRLPNQWYQRSFWCTRIEEYIASLLGTAYLRRHAKGKGINGIDSEKVARDGCKLSDGSSVFAFRRSPNSIPGFHIFVGYSGEPDARVRQVYSWAVADAFKTYVEQKQKLGQSYAEVCRQTKQHRF
jgi:hypothetical protein